MIRFIKLTQAYGSPGKPVWVNPKHMVLFKEAPPIPAIDYLHSSIVLSADEDAENGAIIIHVTELPETITKMIGD